MKQAFIDTETTGLDTFKNGIIQLSGLICIDGEEIDSFNYNIAPLARDILNEKTLSFLKKTEEELRTYPAAQKIKEEFEKLLSNHIDKFDKKDKFFFYAYNTSFDYNFLRNWYTKQDDKFFGSWFWRPAIDIMSLAAEQLIEKIPYMDSFKQSAVAKSLGIEVEEDSLHDALYDVRLARQIYLKLKERK